MKDVPRLFSFKPVAYIDINPLNAELNPLCHFLALLGAHHILHVGSIRVKSWSETFRVTCHPVTVIIEISRSGAMYVTDKIWIPENLII